MTGPARRRNVALAYWVDVADVTYEALAEEITTTARSRGFHNIQPDRSRVGKWIKHSEQPRRPLPALIAETLTRLCRLPRPLTPADLGLHSPPGTGPTGSWKADAVVAAIIDTARSDAVTDETGPSTARMLTGSELISAIQPWRVLWGGWCGTRRVKGTLCSSAPVMATIAGATGVVLCLVWVAAQPNAHSVVGPCGVRPTCRCERLT